MSFDEDAVMRRYATLVDESVRESDVLTNRCDPRWAQPYAMRKFAYYTEKERTLLLHALSQIPLELAMAKSKDDLVRPQLSDDHNTLEFRYPSGMGLDPLMYTFATGYYTLGYSRRSTLWHVNVLWSERTQEHIRSIATRFETLDDCLAFVRAARSLGIVHWKAERDIIAAKRALKQLDDEGIIDTIMDEIP